MLASSSSVFPQFYSCFQHTPGTGFTLENTEMSRQVKTKCVVMGCVIYSSVFWRLGREHLNRAWRDEEESLRERQGGEKSRTLCVWEWEVKRMERLGVGPVQVGEGFEYLPHSAGARGGACFRVSKEAKKVSGLSLWNRSCHTRVSWCLP